MSAPALPPDVDEAIARFGAAVRARFGGRVKDLRLFGSYARGDAWEESDVDVLVLLEGATRAEVEETVAMAHEAGFVGATWVPLSPFVRTPEAFDALRRRELRIALDVDREGIPL
jgi:predicted nucleotidyltransferase